jgi:hypothetical protein
MFTYSKEWSLGLTLGLLICFPMYFLYTHDGVCIGVCLCSHYQWYYVHYHHVILGARALKRHESDV